MSLILGLSTSRHGLSDLMPNTGSFLPTRRTATRMIPLLNAFTASQIRVKLANVMLAGFAGARGNQLLASVNESLLTHRRSKLPSPSV